MATKFFTNEESNTLLDKFAGVFENMLHTRKQPSFCCYFKSRVTKTDSVESSQ